MPRVSLPFLPTSFCELDGFSKVMGGSQLFNKRDELTSFALGGNKTRMFEFLLGKAKEEGTDTHIVGALIQFQFGQLE